MSRRIEVELTSERDDGTFTWRVAGAREPKGVLEGGLLHPTAKVGDVLRAEADFDLDGITITAVLPPKEKRREAPTIEVLGPPPAPPRTEPPTRQPPDRPERRPRHGPRDRDPEGGGRRRTRTDGTRTDRTRTDRTRSDRPGGERPRRSRTGGTRPSSPAPEPKPKPKKLRPARTYRDAVLVELDPAERAVGEQLLRGGLPAVRQALDEQNAAARAEGGPELQADGILSLAERLLPQLRLAEWLDRAEAALAVVDEIGLRDLRSVVVSADDVARDERTRPLADQLRAALDRRTAQAEQDWLADVRGALDAGRVVRALRLSARPPRPGAVLPAEVSDRLAEQAGAALAPDVPGERWATVLDAVAYSPVRRQVTPKGAPEEPGDDVLAAARKHATRVPAAAALVGVEPSPAKARGPRRSPQRGPGRTTSRAASGPPPVPPGPPPIPKTPPPRGPAPPPPAPPPDPPDEPPLSASGA